MYEMDVGDDDQEACGERPKEISQMDMWSSHITYISSQVSTSVKIGLKERAIITRITIIIIK